MEKKVNEESIYQNDLANETMEESNKTNPPFSVTINEEKKEETTDSKQKNSKYLILNLIKLFD